VSSSLPADLLEAKQQYARQVAATREKQQQEKAVKLEQTYQDLVLEIRTCFTDQWLQHAEMPRPDDPTLLETSLFSLVFQFPDHEPVEVMYSKHYRGEKAVWRRVCYPHPARDTGKVSWFHLPTRCLTFEHSGAAIYFADQARSPDEMPKPTKI
jgi:hypothetical protein